jgi:hypothetical protein
MPDLPVDPGELKPGEPPVSTTSFVVGFFLGFVVTVVPAVLLALFIGYTFQGPGKPGVPLVCGTEVLLFALLIYLAWRGRHGPLFRGMLVGGAVAFLLCSACMGYMGTR